MKVEEGVRLDLELRQKLEEDRASPEDDEEARLIEKARL